MTTFPLCGTCRAQIIEYRAAVLEIGALKQALGNIVDCLEGSQPYANELAEAKKLIGRTWDATSYDLDRPRSEKEKL